MEPDRDSLGEMPSIAISYQRNQNDYINQQRYHHRKDSVVSYTPSTNSQTPMVEVGSKIRSVSQSSYGSSNDSGSSNSSARDQVQIAKLKLYLRVGLGILIPIVIILFVAVIYLFIAIHTLQNVHYTHNHDDSRYSKQTDPKREPLCIECTKLQFSLPKENKILDKLTKKMEDGQQLCCADTPEQTDIFMKRYLDIKIKDERASGNLCMGTSSGLSSRDFRSGRSTSTQDGVRCTSSKNPSVHLIGTNDMGGDDSTGPSTITEWADNSDIAFRNSVNFDQKTGILTIPKSGMYYVYSQIHFIQIFPRVSMYPNVDQKTLDKTPNSNSLTHTIKRTHQHYFPEEMLKGRQSQCWVTNKLYSEYTSYLGGIMNLRMGDEIFVEVSNRSMVSNQSKMNFFGLFYVSPNDNK